ncbi:hypothetical protein CQA01_17240 [Cyclobacterium qasimii]|uniref:Uncharacterized protein n=1 Tax=Cyclobacterium qasimii TaxID=1350429 RepID=A0A512CAI9_9BACT|nr:hypothetical protein CQA01_17240 [Cyclobacterium qasimii]
MCATPLIPPPESTRPVFIFYFAYSAVNLQRVSNLQYDLSHLIGVIGYLLTTMEARWPVLYKKIKANPFNGLAFNNLIFIGFI